MKLSKIETRVPVIDQIIALAEPKFLEILETDKSKWESRLGREATESDINAWFFGYVFDMVKSLGKYFTKEDVLDSTYAPRISSGKTGFNISVAIIRSGKSEFFRTEAIIAGGHSIQCLHYRYIAHTELKCLVTNPAYEKLNADKKKMSKIERIESDLELKINTANRHADCIKAAQTKVDLGIDSARSEFMAEYPFNRGKWSTIENGLAEYNAWVEENACADLNRYKRDVVDYTRWYKDSLKDIKKTEIKLELARS